MSRSPSVRGILGGPGWVLQLDRTPMLEKNEPLLMDSDIFAVLIALIIICILFAAGLAFHYLR